MTYLIAITIISIALLFGAIYHFLPRRFHTSQTKWAAGLSSLLAAALTIYDLSEKYNHKIFAHLTKGGKINNSKNFQWKIIKEINNGQTIYLIEDLHTGISQVKIETSSYNQNYSLYSAFGGIAIKFHIPEKDIKDFDIYIDNSL